MSRLWEHLLGPKVQRDDLFRLRETLRQKLEDPRFATHREAAEVLREYESAHYAIEDGWIKLGLANELSAEQQKRVKAALETFKPWKKGPYEIFGHKIDAEWRSDLKWDRLLPTVGDLSGQFVADIGCHNGYFMYRMREQGAAHVLGFEPVPLNSWNHQLLQNVYPLPDISLELFGVEHIDLFPETFDTIFCLGILYHHTDPIGLLRKMKGALKKGGRLFIDCQGISNPEALSLTPGGRYAGAAGVWYLPSLGALENWIRRAGFSQQTLIYSAALDSSEQRATDWAPIESLKDFLDPNDKSRTREGYPAPYRHYVLAKA